ncbi:MAG: type II secretion system protein GspE, partial [Candidatus Aureabacteria bacterium]|nr:type II secretion system protein GspE [Candidatus Auribacterota bacterium]
MTSMKDRLGAILLEKGLLTKPQLDEAYETQKTSGGRLSKILVSKGFVDEKKLIGTLGEYLGIPPIDLSKLKLDPDVVELIPQNICEFYCLIPIARIGNALSVAMADPLNVF